MYLKAATKKNKHSDLYRTLKLYQIKGFLTMAVILAALNVSGQIWFVDSLYNITDEPDNFGNEIIIDRNELFISKPGSQFENRGSVFCYEYAGGSILALQTIEDTLNSQLGRRIAKTGNHLLLSHTINGTAPVDIYSKDTDNTWKPKQRLDVFNLPIELQPLAFDLAASGNNFVLSCQNYEYYYGVDFFSRTGNVYVFEFNENDSAVLKQELNTLLERNGMDFGYSVDIDSNYIVVGSPGFYKIEGNDSLFYMGAAFVFRQDTSGKWNELGELLAFDRRKANYFGLSVCIDYPFIVVGAPVNSYDKNGLNEIYAAGGSYLYRIKDNSIEFVDKITSVSREYNENFGVTNSLCDSMLIIGSMNAPSLYRITRDGVIFVRSFESGHFLFGASEFGVSMGKELFCYQVEPMVQFAEDYFARKGVVRVYSYDKENLFSGSPDITQFEVSIYPNPVTDRLNIILPPDMGKPVKVIIIGLEGQTVLENMIYDDDAQMIDCTAWYRGVYLLILQTKTDVIRKKIIRI